MDEFGQPRCPACGVVMRTGVDAFECPVCGRRDLFDEVVMPPEFDGPDIHGR